MSVAARQTDKSTNFVGQIKELASFILPTTPLLQRLAQIHRKYWLD